MPVIIDYILKLNICLGVVYLFYQLFLRKLTFYNWNRWYLLGYTALSFIIPLIDIMPSLQKRDLQSTVVMQWIPVINFVPPTDRGFFETLTYWDWSVAVLVAGILVLLVRFLIRFYSFKKMKSRAQLLSDDQTKIYQLDEHVTPFSFGNSIFINMEMHHGEELEEIIRHEFVHVRQRHTIDILWCELLCTLNWFNPFVWLLRHNVKQNLEFIADNKVLQNGFNKKEYQYLLLKVLGSRQFAFTNHFNFSSLKKRIIMMNTIKSAKVHLIKFMFLLPVVAILLLSFRKEVIKRENQQRTVSEALTENSSPDTRGTDGIIKGDASGSKKDTVPTDKKQMPVILLRGVKDAEKQPLIVLDGVEKEKGFNMNQIAAEDIERISILKDAAATSLYGDKAANGVVNITTKGAASSTIGVRGAKTFDGKAPLYIVDGKPVESSEFRDINPNRIKSVSVLKDAAATSLYGPEGENGVILIVTKKIHPKEDSITISAKGDRVYLRQAGSGGLQEMEANKIIMSADGKSIVFAGNAKGRILPDDTKIIADTMVYNSPVSRYEIAASGNEVKSVEPPSLKGKVAGVQVSPKKNDEVTVVGYGIKSKTEGSNKVVIRGSSGIPANAYYVIDGRKAKKKDIDKLGPNTIKSVDVLKGESAVKYYGTKAREGAIIITTK